MDGVSHEQRAFALVVDLLALPPEQREAHLQVASDDEGFRRRVEILLKAAEEAEAAEKAEEKAPAATPPVTQAGPYRLGQAIGQGGMGEVYIGVRDDGEVERKVAVKLLHPWRTESRDRFQAERQILARLEHPNIARLYEVGTIKDGAKGRPYLVMELIEGQQIDTYCREHRSTIQERLSLFEQVCAAVSYAHRNLVIHRDVKPGNILVTSEGVPKLLDFGIAKSLSDEDHKTRTGRAPLTPAYASPEQASGGHVTTASDIYSLGVVLFELLTGERPSEDSNDPTRPSVAAARRGSEELSRHLQGDLDAILLKALRTEPESRYPTVEAFTEDIRRHLEDLPVQARDGALSYTLQKFYQRHRPAVFVGVAALLVLVVFVLALIRQTQISERERIRAERAFATLTSAFKSSDPEQARGGDITARQILDQGAEKVRSELAEEPEMQANLLTAMGEVYVSLGLFDTAEGLHREALALRRGDPDETASLYQLGEVEWGRRSYVEAEQHYRAALAMLEKGTIQHAQALRGLGLALERQGHEGGREALSNALRALEEHFDKSDPEIIRATNGLARAAKSQGNYEEAERLLRDMVKIQRPGGPRPSLGRTLAELGDVRRLQDELIEAKTLLEEAIPMIRMAGETTYFAEVLGKLAPLLNRLGLYAEAEGVLREILAESPRKHPATPKSLHNLGISLTAQSELKEAQEVVLEAITLMESGAGLPRELAASRCLLGKIHLKMEAPVKAFEQYRTCLAMNETITDGVTRIDAAWLGLGEAIEEIDGCEAALEWYERAYHRRVETLGTKHFRTALAAGKLGACLNGLYLENLKVDDWPDSAIEKLLIESLETLRKEGFRDDNPYICKAVKRLTTYYQSRDQKGALDLVITPSCL